MMYNDINEYIPYNYVVMFICDDDTYEESNIRFGKQYVVCAKRDDTDLLVFDMKNPFNDFVIPEDWTVFNGHYVHFNINDFKELYPYDENITKFTLTDFQRKRGVI